MAAEVDIKSIPIIDVGALRGEDFVSKKEIARQIGEACKNIGFFYITNHGISTDLRDRLFHEGKRFFRLPVEQKNQIAMTKSRVFRGYFEVGGELTSNRPDVKEGLYFCTELNDSHPAVIAKKPVRYAFGKQ